MFQLLFSAVFRVSLITVAILLTIEGFLTEALKVTSKEGQLDWATEEARKLVEQTQTLIETLLGLF